MLSRPKPSSGTPVAQVTDAKSCVAWLESVPLTHAPEAQEAITRQINALAKGNLPALERLRILEVLRDPIDFVQGELARRYRGKPVPQSISEFAVWTSVVTLWDSVRLAYQRSLEAADAGDREMLPYAPLACLRMLGLCGAVMGEHYRAYREVPAAAWTRLNETFALAEGRGYANLPIEDTFGQRDPARTCTAAYAHTVLAALGDPYALGPRQMDFVFQWLDAWSTLVGFAASAPPAGTGTVLAVDLAGSTGAVPAASLEPGSGVRFLNVSQLSAHLRRILAALRQGSSPAQLGLGQECRQPGCEKLLTLLYIQWCGAGTGRMNERSPDTERVMVCQGMHAVHYHVGGKPFRQPGARPTRQEEQDLALFGRVSDRTELAQVSQASRAIETWQIANQRAPGFLGLVRSTEFDARVAHGEIIAIRRAANARFQLGVVQWLKHEEGCELFVCVRLLPGTPQAVAVRIAGSARASEKFERGVLLLDPADAAGQATVVLESGWFQPGRFLDLRLDDRTLVAKLESLVETGSGFERAKIVLPK